MSKLVRTVLPDYDDRVFIVEVPNDAGEEDYAKGVVIGPPDLAPLELPADLELRLHDELLARNLITAADARRRPNDVVGAWQAALKKSVSDLLNLYLS